MSKVMAPALPEGYRFKVSSYRNYTKIALQKKLIFFWFEIEYHVAIKDTVTPVVIQQKMENLIRLFVNERVSSEYDGCYPPRKEIG